MPNWMWGIVSGLFATLLLILGGFANNAYWQIYENKDINTRQSEQIKAQQVVIASIDKDLDEIKRRLDDLRDLLAKAGK